MQTGETGLRPDVISDDTAKGSKPMGEPTDQELFESAIANEPVQEVSAEPAVQPEAAPEVARDEQGRFAPREAAEDKAEEPAAATEPEKQDGRVPSGLLREEKENRRRLEAELAELRGQMKAFQQFQQPRPAEPAPQPPVDVWSDPDAWAEQRVKSTVDPVMQQMRTVLMHNAKLVASSIHGADKIGVAEQAFNEAAQRGAIDPVEYQRVQNDPNPFDAAVRWHERQTLLSEIGDDRQAYERKIIEKYLASQNQQPAPAAQPQAPGSVVRLPPSLNRATSAASPNGAGADAVSDAALFNSITARRR
jgi:hypothetical protein